MEHTLDRPSPVIDENLDIEPRGGIFAIRPGYKFWTRDYWFGQVDSRPLSVFRIVFGLLLLKDAFYHIFIAREFYSDKGVVPLNAMRQMVRDSRFSLMDSMAQPWLVTAFFILWCVVLVLLIVGYRTRLMTVLNFILILSVHERNIWVLNGADTVMRALCFWMLFIPLGQYYSLDVVRRRWNRFRLSRRLDDLRSPAAEDTSERTVFAFPVRLITLQVALIYLFTIYLKMPAGDGFAPWRQGTALYYALQVKSLTQLPGDLFVQWMPMWLLATLDYFTLIVEGSFIITVFFPFFQPVLRKAGLLGVALLHTGIGVMMSIGNFSMVMISSYITFFEPDWLTIPGARLRGPEGKVFVSQPGRSSPLWLLLPATRASEIAIDGKLPIEEGHADGWSATVGGDVETGEDAWRLVARHMPLSKLWAWMLRYAWLRRWIWALAAYYVERNPAVTPDPEAVSLTRDNRWSKPGKVFTVAAAGFVMFGVIWMNIRSLDLPDHGAFVWLYESGPWAEFYGSDTYNDIYRVFNTPARSISMWQEWGMFSPYPTTRDGWIVIPGKFEDGTEYDLLTGEPVNTEWHRWFFGPDMRWKKYESNLDRMDDADTLLGAWGSHFCREYNVDGDLPEGQRLATLEIHYYWYRSTDPGGEPNELQDKLLWRHWCYAKYAY